MFWKRLSGEILTEGEKIVFTGSVIKRKFRRERVWRYSQNRISRWREAAHWRPAAQTEGNCRERSGRSQVLVEQEKPSKEKGWVVLLVTIDKLNLILPWTSYMECPWCYLKCFPFWPLGKMNGTMSSVWIYRRNNYKR